MDHTNVVSEDRWSLVAGAMPYVEIQDFLPGISNL